VRPPVPAQPQFRLTGRQATKRAMRCNRCPATNSSKHHIHLGIHDSAARAWARESADLSGESCDSTGGQAARKGFCAGLGALAAMYAPDYLQGWNSPGGQSLTRYAIFNAPYTRSRSHITVWMMAIRCLGASFTSTHGGRMEIRQCRINRLSLMYP